MTRRERSGAPEHELASKPAPAIRTGDRVAKLLARAGIASRREVERMIEEGRVARDGIVVETANTVLPSLAGVTVDGRPVAAPAPARLFLYHKPAGLLVTERDPGGRPTIYDRLPPELPRVVPVGRLDLNTEGLLILTTDGGIKRQLELPATGVPRTYRARAHGPVTQAQLEELIDGVEIEGIRYGSIDANLERRTGANVWIELTLTEGKNREVRRVLEHLGLQVGRLIRTRYGPFVLGDLPPGEVGEVRQHDLVAFRQSLRGKRAAPVDAIVPSPIRPARKTTEREDRIAAPPKRQWGDSRPQRADRPRAAPGSGKEKPPRKRSDAAGGQRGADVMDRSTPSRGNRVKVHRQTGSVPEAGERSPKPAGVSGEVRRARAPGPSTPPRTPRQEHRGAAPPKSSRPGKRKPGPGHPGGTRPDGGKPRPGKPRSR